MFFSLDSQRTANRKLRSPHRAEGMFIIKDAACPCCGSENIKAMDSVFRCLDTTTCPLANTGGHFGLMDGAMKVWIGERRYDCRINHEHLMQWADAYRIEKGSSEIKVGDVGYIINGKHHYNNGIRVVITEVCPEKDNYHARNEKPVRPALFFVLPEQIIGKAVRDAIVTLNGEVKQHPHNVPDLQTDGKRVRLADFMTSKDGAFGGIPYWAAYSLDNVSAYNYYLLGRENFRK